MQWEKFKPEFHESYHSKVQKWIESEDCDDLYKYLKDRSRMGHKIAPISSLTWRIFKELPLNEIKVVIMGLDPYNKFINGVSIADGISMSCSITGKLQPTLEKWYNALELELNGGLNLNYKKDPDLLPLVKQGVFLTNAALTTEMGKAGIHLDKWEPFQKFFLEEILPPGIPILFLGKEAQKLDRYTQIFTHCFYLSHPASASYNSGDWETNGVFKKLNVIVKENSGKEIDWLCDLPPF